jgi:hypothetical protein
MNETNDAAEDALRDRPRTLIEGVDYYFEDGLMVLTRHFLLERGYCCENGCRNCPYGFTKPTLE